VFIITFSAAAVARVPLTHFAWVPKAHSTKLERYHKLTILPAVLSFFRLPYENIYILFPPYTTLFPLFE
jgi:hypothetical protein